MAVAKKIQIYDTTLRDGAQTQGVDFSLEDKALIAEQLDGLGLDYVEAGYPGANPTDTQFFSDPPPLKHARLVAFGMTKRAGRSAANDPGLSAVFGAGTKVVCLVGKTWDFHVKVALQVSLEENLSMIRDSVAYAAKKADEAMLDAEHFFDGYKADQIYALETLRAAVRGGAETVVLCDTNGGSMPWEIADIVRAVKAALNHPLGIHTHNDGECAVANSLAAIREGAIQVQGTINGYGERCGNANLCSIIPDLELKLSLPCVPAGNLPKLYEVAHFVAEVTNLAPDEHLAYVGKSAFAHKGGIHVAAMRRNPHSYQHVEPQQVGNHMRVVVSELSGRGNLLSKAEEYGLDVNGGAEVAGVLNEIKALEAQGFSFEAAEASVAMMMKRQQPAYAPPFELIDFSVNVENRKGRGMFAEATVKISVGGEVLHTAAEGNGPVNALDAALRKALTPRYPMLAHFHLADYKVRILDGNNGTAATTRVLIDTQNGAKRWSTVGASTNIIEASWRALVDSVEYGLTVAA